MKTLRLMLTSFLCLPVGMVAASDCAQECAEEGFMHLAVGSPAEVVSTTDLTTLATFSSLIGLCFAAVVLLLLMRLNGRDNGFWKMVSRHLPLAFSVVWLLGFVVYDVGMYTGHEPSLLANAFMAVIHAFGMFILTSDVSAVHTAFHNNWLFMGAFSLAHFLAAFVSMVFVIKHFGFNIVAACRMMMASWPLARSKEDTYVFWGMNDATYYLARDIKRHHQDDQQGRIIIVRTNNDSDSVSARNGMERMFNFLSLKNQDLDRLQDLDCLTTNTFGDLSQLSPIDSDGNKTLLSELGLSAVARIIRRHTKRRLHLFFLSDDESYNIECLATIRRDPAIAGFVAGGGGVSRKAVLYCHARYNSIHRVVEDEQPLKNVEVKVVDSSHISVELLKQDVRLQPVSYVDIEPDATVSSPFNALVVGFGEVGADAVRFLYEFGAFVGAGDDSKSGQRSPFHCHVVDSGSNTIAGLFVANTPSISVDVETETDSTHQPAAITLHRMDCMGVEFYQQLSQWVKELNYVVVATDDDEQNVSLGVRIFRLAVRYRENLEHFRILVRVKNDENGHFLRVAHHYNRLWAAHLNSPDGVHQQVVSDHEEIDEPITIFGEMSQTYQYKYVVDEELKELGKRFKYRYDLSAQKHALQNGLEAKPPRTWEEEYVFYMQMDEDHKGFAPTYDSVMRLRRSQTQNFGNSLHVLTKRKLALTALGSELYETISSGQLYRHNNDTTYHWKDPSQANPQVTDVLLTLAQTEHLRWEASHRILGYSDAGDETFKDEARLLHGCLKPWNQLSVEVQSYDCNVVDVSLDDGLGVGL